MSCLRLCALLALLPLLCEKRSPPRQVSIAVLSDFTHSPKAETRKQNKSLIYQIPLWLCSCSKKSFQESLKWGKKNPSTSEEELKWRAKSSQVKWFVLKGRYSARLDQDSRRRVGVVGREALVWVGMAASLEVASSSGKKWIWSSAVHCLPHEYWKAVLRWARGKDMVYGVELFSLETN